MMPFDVKSQREWRPPQSLQSTKNDVLIKPHGGGSKKRNKTAPMSQNIGKMDSRESVFENPAALLKELRKRHYSSIALFPKEQADSKSKAGMVRRASSLDSPQDPSGKGKGKKRSLERIETSRDAKLIKSDPSIDLLFQSHRGGAGIGYKKLWEEDIPDLSSNTARIRRNSSLDSVDGSSGKGKGKRLFKNQYSPRATKLSRSDSSFSSSSYCSQDGDEQDDVLKALRYILLDDQSDTQEEPVTSKVARRDPYSNPGSVDSIFSTYTVGSPENLLEEIHSPPSANLRKIEMRQRLLKIDSQERVPTVTRLKVKDMTHLIEEKNKALDNLYIECELGVINKTIKESAKVVEVNLSTTECTEAKIQEAGRHHDLDLDIATKNLGGLKRKNADIRLPKAIDYHGQRVFQGLNTICVLLKASAENAGVKTVEIQAAFGLDERGKGHLYISSNTEEGQNWLIESSKNIVTGNIQVITDKLTTGVKQFSSSTPFASALKFLFHEKQKELRNANKELTFAEKIDQEYETAIYLKFRCRDYTVVKNPGARHAEQNIVAAMKKAGNFKMVAIAGTKIPCGGCAAELGTYLRQGDKTIQGVLYPKQAREKKIFKMIHNQNSFYAGNSELSRSGSVVANKIVRK